MSTYASNGYMVFMPDNIFEEGRPGTSALDGIVSAANKLIELGYSDKDRIGLQGHSWSGYQTSFILTQTDMFKCIVTGAPPTNLESFYNDIYASTGTVHHGIMETGQVRMGRGVTPWTHREIYQRENPMYHIQNIKTPFLILHGTKDGAVDWSQGLELYNAARRMGKEVIFLSYPNEGHHLTNLANQKDFLTRMKEYFDYYLMDKPAAPWMVKGVPHLEKLYEKAQ
jgi:dipeptidyl aminopeptidase/acylaminoacyl peptidase